MFGRSQGRFRLVLLLLACVVGAITGVGAQESASYVVDRMTISAAPARASSTSYEIKFTAAQEGPAGSVSFCNMAQAQTVGFWSLFGHPLVPVVLEAARNGSEPFDVDLTWSGSTPEFEVYRSTLADSVVDVANLAIVTSSCSATDAPPSAPIVFYLVVPTTN